MAVADTLTVIRSLFHPHKIQPCIDGSLIIKEIDRRASMKLVKLDSVGASAFAMEYDGCKFPGESLFAPAHALHRACDSIAFCVVDGKPFIMCFELKSSEPDRTEVAEQFRNAHCFLDYLGSLLANYFKCDPIQTWPRRYFVFHNQGETLAKRASREEYDNDTPERAHFFAVQNGKKIFMREILGKPQ